MREDVIDKFVKSLVSIYSRLNAIEREQMFPKPKIPTDYTPTEKIVHKMLIENTGANMLDSGDFYGRHWEINRLIEDFRKIPYITQKVYDDFVSIKYHVFHYLTNNCEYHKELDKKFHKFANSPEYEEEPWLVCMEDFCSEYLCIDDTKFKTINTYNYENILSQVLQYTMFTFDDFNKHCYIILQTHNGCDVRGGYSTPHVFKVYDYEKFILAQYYILALCKKCNTEWFSDDAGYHWYSDKGDEVDTEWNFDEYENKVFHKNCGGEIIFDVLHNF